MTEAVRPFRITVEQAEIDQLNKLLDLARYPDDISNSDKKVSQYGITLSWVKKLVHEWRNEFNWTAFQKEMNRFPSFKVVLPSGRPSETLDTHFVHVRSQRSDAVPLLLCHGWPGSFNEFFKVVEGLTEPSDSKKLAFHVVIPSIPGYTYSQAPSKPGFTVVDTASLYDNLMIKLGYNQYVVQGGDWGSIIARIVATNHSNHCQALHLNFLPAPMPTGLSFIPQRLLGQRFKNFFFTETELRGLQRGKMFRQSETGYYAIQATKPMTLGFAHAASPVGVLAWLGEKFAKSEGMDSRHILSLVSLFWLTNSSTSSYMIYKENAQLQSLIPRFIVPIPTGLSQQSKEISCVPRSWADTTVKGGLKWYTEDNDAGHFFAVDNPALFVKDLQDCYATLLPLTSLRSKI